MLVGDIPSDDNYAIVGGEAAKTASIELNTNTFRILSDTLYSNKIRAVSREILCNAVDAHIAAGRADVPVEVTLTDHELMIRDFGDGIPEDKLADVYLTYMKSTKSDDPTQTGGFGLGSKSPLAYTDHFTVTNRNGGTQSVHVVHQGTEETRGAPGIRRMTVGPTEESGLSVSVPIKNTRDRDEFDEWISRTALQGGMRVRMNGLLLDRRNLDNLAPGSYALVARPSHETSVQVLYGNVQYPISGDHFINEFAAVEKLINYRGALLLRALPSSVTVAPSRETLSFDDRTIKAIGTMLRRAVSEIKATIKKTAVVEWNKAFDMANQIGPFRRPPYSDAHDRFDLLKFPVHLAGDSHLSGDLCIGAEAIANELVRRNFYRSSNFPHPHNAVAKAALRRVKSLPPGSKTILKDHDFGLGPGCLNAIAGRRMRVIARRIVRDLSVPHKIYFREGWTPIPETRETTSLTIERLLVIGHSRESVMSCGKNGGIFLVSKNLTEDMLKKLTYRAGRFGFSTFVAPKPEPKPKVKKEKIEVAPRVDTWQLFNAREHTKAYSNEPNFSYHGFSDVANSTPRGFVRYYVYNDGIRLHTEAKRLAILVAASYPDIVIAKTPTEHAKLVERGVRELEDIFLDEITAHIKNKLLPRYLGIFGKLRHYYPYSFNTLAAIRSSRRMAHMLLNIPYREDETADRLFKLVALFEPLHFQNRAAAYGRTWPELIGEIELRQKRFDEIQKLRDDDIKPNTDVANAIDMLSNRTFEKVSKPENVHQLVALVSAIMKTTKTWKDDTCKAV